MVGKSVEEVLKRNRASGSTGFRAGPHYWRRGPSVCTPKANFEALSKAGRRDICEGSDTNNETDPSQTTHQLAYFAQDLKLFRGRINVCAAALIRTAGLTRSHFDSVSVS